MTNEEQDGYIKALLRERSGYEQRADKAGVAAVNQELSRLGHEAEPKAKRAAKRPAKKKTTKR